MTTDADVRDLLSSRGIRPRSTVPLTVGQKNVTLLVKSEAGDRYIVRLYASATPAEVEYELDAVGFLSARGFPTPAPITAANGQLAGYAGDRPAAVFIFASGSHPSELAIAHRQDLKLGLQAAALAGRLHQLTRGRSFAGQRTDRLDPLRRITGYFDGPLASLPALEQATEQLVELKRTLTDIYVAASMPRGLIHNDISAHNLLLDGGGSVTALIDFDDCMTSFLLFDLGRIVEVWGSDEKGNLDIDRVTQLIDAYSRERTLSHEEARHATVLIAGYAAATGADVLARKLQHRQPISGPRDSNALSVALQLAAGT